MQQFGPTFLGLRLRKGEENGEGKVKRYVFLLTALSHIAALHGNAAFHCADHKEFFAPVLCFLCAIIKAA
jgi:hypothetical protein